MGECLKLKIKKVMVDTLYDVIEQYPNVIWSPRGLLNELNNRLPKELWLTRHSVGTLCQKQNRFKVFRTRTILGTARIFVPSQKVQGEFKYVNI